MRVVTRCFNLLFVTLLAVGLLHADRAAAAASSSATNAAPASKSGKKAKKPKPLERLRVHLESRHDLAERSLLAQLGTDESLKFSVERLPILNEVHVEAAALIDEPGGAYQMQIRFNSMGSKLLEGYSASATGRHLLLMTDIDGEARWIGAPLIRRRIADGIIAFSPTVSRDIVERLVFGLNDAIRKKRKRWLED